MGRLVRKPRLATIVEPQPASDFGGIFQPTRAPAAASTAADAGDDYLTRMAKYVPAEVLGFFMIVNAILAQAVAAVGDNATMAGFSVTSIAIGALLVGIVLTPLFCWYVREDGDAWTINAAVSTVAFPFWAYLMGAVAFTKFHDGNLAVILILTFTAVSGLVAPMADEPEQAEQKGANPKDGPRLVENLKA
jgi:hypothetical protein